MDLLVVRRSRASILWIRILVYPDAISLGLGCRQIFPYLVVCALSEMINTELSGEVRLSSEFGISIRRRKKDLWC